ncbi:nitrite reductase [Pontibacillus sp. HMF3514]|uniref:nitrite reductase n=1 Tax=Pontibacillus sp. HMF3514 TaxID=2692425 RepID=UPI00131FEB31|nr:nitrite reductase [Pontibacillus sp. HMF3514]QHE52348.1 nitrite reductase [Pontibacillus sp. HMF3514]
MVKEKMVSLAVNGGIQYGGSKLTGKQLIVLGKHLDEDQEVELTTFQSIYIKVPESKVDPVQKELQEVGFSVYKNGPYVKNLRTCSFCKGEEKEGMPIAIELNKRIAGKEVPFPLRPSYTGCPNACGEPLVNDIGVLKRGETYEVYIGGQATGTDAKAGMLFEEGMTPEQLYTCVDRIIEVYKENGKKREKFSKFINRYGFDSVKRDVCIIEE